MHFAQAMQPIEKQVHDAFEVVRLESWLDDDIKCQAEHKDAHNQVCSGDVTYVFTSCVPPKMVCSNTANHVEYVLSFARADCEYCETTVAEHWKVVPA